MSTTFTPLPEASTADLVADRLRDAILDGNGLGEDGTASGFFCA